ncbi:MAG: hypothetical protein JST79_20215 [Acidobacteria bacterium]|jgi:hypothetical protein|nr:hypothetical protein [Acidobacteriota bacterium]
MPRMIDLIRASAVPANLMQSAARGALSVPPQEMLEILVYLATQNKVFGEQARLTLAGWEEAASKAVAADPQAPREVLEYLSAPENLRPALLPELVGNPGLPEEFLTRMATAVSREAADLFLQSPRCLASQAVLQALQGNHNLSGIQTQQVEEKLADSAEKTPSALADGAAATPAPAASSGTLSTPESEGGAAPDDAVLDEEVIAYLSTHEKEILAEGEKPFQAIGGVFDEVLESAENGKENKSAGNAKKTPAAKKTSQEEERGSALQKIAKLDVKGRIQLALKGTKEERSLLIRDGTKLVAMAVLESPKISDGEVEKFASQKNVLEAVLRAIPMKRRFAKNYAVVRNLVFNPRTPLDLSLGLMKNILINDLRNLSGNKEVSETVRKLALKMFKQKSDPTKKNV